MNDLQSQLLGSTINLKLNTYNGSGGSVTATTFDQDSIRIYKNGGLTQRSSAAGITVTVDFDSVVGCHKIQIDTSDDTDDGFYSADAFFEVMAVGVTVDGQTVNPWIGSFRLSAKPNVDDLNDFNQSTQTVTVGTNNDKSDYAITTANINAIISALNAGTYDGISFSTAIQLLVALGRGNISVAGVGSGTLTITLFAQNGTTPLATFTQPETGVIAGSRTRQ